ncbi:MAG TPA: alpha-amylase family glycosyl hydrolase, partial [Bacillaceae bacterium]
KIAVVLLLVPFLLFSAFPVSADEKEERTIQDEIIYSLMVDRFQNGNSENDFDIDANDPLRFQGGDFKGIQNRLDYLRKNGFTVLHLSPIFDNEDNGYHGEWIRDFYKTEEHYGTIEEFKDLVKSAHEKDLKIVADFVLTHVGPNHPWTKDAGKSDWLDPSREIRGGIALNLENPEVREYLTEAAKWWIKETDLDGFSIQGLEEVPVEFLRSFSHEVKAAKSNFYLMGSAKAETSEELAGFQEAGLTLVSDNQLVPPLREAFSKVNGPMAPLFEQWTSHSSAIEKPQSLGAFFDNKDMERFTRDMVNNKEYPGTRWKLALAYLYTQPEVPVIYYGTEIAVDGGLPPENQKVMDFRTDEEFLAHIQKLGTIRQEQRALSNGTMELLYEKGGMAVYKRQWKEETIVVAINNTDQTQSVLLDGGQLEADMELRGLLGTDLVRSDGDRYNVTLERETAEIYKLNPKSGYNIPFILAMLSVFVIFAIFMYVVWKRGKNKNPYQK